MQLTLGLIASILMPVVPNAASTPVPTSRSLKFDTVFSPAGEPATLHFRAVFKAKGVDHRLEVWRDGERRVKRMTDRALVTYAVCKPGDENYQLQILDLHKRVSTHIDRTTMLRLGNFASWFDLTHGLRQPAGAYQLVRGATPITTARPPAPCEWYTLTQSGHATRLCWSHADRLPLLILVSDATPVWQVIAIDRDHLPAGVFKVADNGFIKVDTVGDADRD